jgi:pimeloyl-ACP methyl ester carboxylesterase
MPLFWNEVARLSQINAPVSLFGRVFIETEAQVRKAHILLTTLIAASGLAGLVFLSYGDELRRARDEASRGSVIAMTAAGPIEYGQSGTGIPLLSIHGAGGGYDQGLANAIDLIGEGYSVIAPSRFGYLRTPIPPDTSPAAQADAHAALLSELRVSEAIVVGISAGARSAVEFALRHPERLAALILIVPGTYSPTSPVAIEESRGSQFAFWLVNNGADFAWWAAETISPSMLIRFVGVPPEVVWASPEAEQDRIMRIVRSIEPLSSRFPGINIDSNPNLGPLPLEKISVPTLIISARDDLFNTLPAAEFAASKIPNSTLVVYDTGGHLLVNRTGEVRDVVKRFLSSAGLAARPSEANRPVSTRTVSAGG